MLLYSQYMPIMPMQYAYFCHITKRKTRQWVRIVINCFFLQQLISVSKKNPSLAIMGTYACLDHDERRMEKRASYSRSNH